MQRRTFLQAMVGTKRRPNLLFLLTDDQRADLLSCAGHPILRTPNIDRLATSGVRFQNNFCATAICCTSRATILSGLHERTHKISNFRTPLSAEAIKISYPHLLRQAGFKTGFVGKYGVGGDAAPKELFDTTFGNPGLERVGQSREIGNQAIQFLNGVTVTDNFCLSVSFRAPHARDADPKQYLYDPEEANLYRDLQVPVPLKADPKYFDRMPDYVRNSESRERWKKRFTSPEHYQESVKSYFRLIIGVDQTIGTILTTLAQRGLADNTVIVFSSDNGYFLGEMGLADKWYAYEESIRTPLIIYDPRLPQRQRGTTRSQMTLNTDIAPTLLSLAGLPVPEATQGRDLTPLLRGDNPRWRKDWFYSHYFPGNPPTVVIPRSEGIRSEQWKYIRWIDSQPLREEVYNLRRDPSELSNLDNASQQAKLRNRWQKWRDALEQWNPSQRWQDPQ